jgi:hypothetical protein
MLLIEGSFYTHQKNNKLLPAPRISIGGILMKLNIPHRVIFIVPRHRLLPCPANAHARKR